MKPVNKRVYLALAVWIWASFLGICLAGTPNILLIVSEDNGAELGCYGEPFVRTPVLDRLAAEGVRFANAYVPQAGCSQSRAALLTGLYPHQNGQIGLATWKCRLYDPSIPNLVRQLKQVGYRTGLIGKLHINPASAFPFDFRSIKNSNFARENLAGYQEAAAEFIAAADSPFFLSVNYPDAHRPFTPQVDGLPEKPLTGEEVEPLAYFGLDTPELREQTANYYNCMERLDQLVGDLLDVLEASGKADNTLVVYLGDHGADMLRGKRTCYEGGTRVPLILRWWQRQDPEMKGRVVSDLVSTLDLMPTLLEVAGASAVAKLPGQSLVPVMRGEVMAPRFLFTEYHLHSAHNFYPQRAVRGSRFKLIRNLLAGQPNPGVAFTHARFFTDLDSVLEQSTPVIRAAYDRMRRPPEYELYDLIADPHEFVNLADNPRYREQLEMLQARLSAWRVATQDPLLRVENLTRLKAEVDRCFVEGAPVKARLNWHYPEYFFTHE